MLDKELTKRKEMFSTLDIPINQRDFIELFRFLISNNKSDKIIILYYLVLSSHSQGFPNTRKRLLKGSLGGGGGGVIRGFTVP